VTAARVSPIAPGHRPDATTAGALDLIVARVRLHARRRVAWLAHRGTAAATRPGGDLALDPALLACLDERDTPDAEARWLATAEVAPLERAIADVDAALAGPTGAALRRIAELFKLERADLDVLALALAVHVEPALGSACAYLQRHPGRTYATAPLAARLFGHGLRPVFGPASPLAQWGLVVAGDAPPGEAAPLIVDPELAAWLHGDLRVDPALVGAVREVPRHPPLPRWPVDDAAAQIRAAIQRGEPIRLVVVAAPGSGRRTFAAAVGARLGLRTIAVDAAAIADADWSAAWVRAQRLAIVGRAVLVWHGGPLDRPWPSHLAVAPVQVVVADDGQVVAPCALAIDHRLELPAADLADRRQLWTRSAPTWPDDAVETLAARHRLTAGEIAAVGRRAPADPAAAAAACRAVGRHGLGDLAQPLECPFGWGDLVVSEPVREALADFAFEARDRARFWEESGARRLFPRGRALVGLLAGPPGTGKTMAAQVIAAELELDLHRIDLASMVSKYVGETAKNLRRLFARAARQSAVLLFDEADALFARRTDVRDSLDRHANADTNYLLQLLEEYQGIALLATNRKADLDPAFVRRIRYVVDFPLPTPAQRLRIWQQVLAVLDVAAVERLGAAGLAELAQIEMTGAQIKNAGLAGAFAARRDGAALVMPFLVRGVERELGKDGRAIGKRERERLLKETP
jgi:hypothetical protein